MSEPIPFKNANGRTLWQPNSGEERLWRTDIGTQWMGKKYTYGRYGPRLYPYKRALRIGNRRERRLARGVFKRLEPADE